MDLKLVKQARPQVSCIGKQRLVSFGDMQEFECGQSVCSCCTHPGKLIHVAVYSYAKAYQSAA